MTGSFIILFIRSVQVRAFLEALVSEGYDIRTMHLPKSAILLDDLLETADLHIVRIEVGIEYVTSVMGAEVGHEVASEVPAKSLNAGRDLFMKVFGDQVAPRHRKGSFREYPGDGSGSFHWTRT